MRRLKRRPGAGAWVKGAAIVALLGLAIALAARWVRPSAGAGSRATPSFQTFYISYATGSEANDGTSESTPWKLAPGMQGFSASYTHEAGDHFIFEGGVRWPNSTLPLVATGSGEPDDEDYYGVNESWYSGSAYEAPVFDAEGENTQGKDPKSGLDLDDMLWMNQLDYITVEGIHLENWTASKLTEPAECNGISLNGGGTYSHPQEGHGDEHIHLNKISFTGWYVDAESFRANYCKAIDSDGLPSAETSLTNSTVEGTTGGTFGWSVQCVSRIEHDVIGKATNLVTPCPDTADPKVAIVADNRLFDCGYPKWPAGETAEDIHADAIQSSDGPPQTGETDYIYDNVVYNTGYTGEGVYEGGEGHEGECESSLLGGETGTHLVTDYLWNNVYYDIGGNGPSSDGSSESFYAWNNSIEGGLYGTAQCMHASHDGVLIDFVWENNLCISDAPDATDGVASSGSDPVQATGSETIGHSLVLAPEQAAIKAAGYATPAEVGEARRTYAYSPLSASAAGVGKGDNRATLCAGALLGLCEDTAYAGAREPLQRPSAGAWDIGAYQLNGEPATGAGGSSTGTTDTQTSSSSSSTPAGATSTGTCDPAACPGPLAVAIESTHARVVHSRTRLLVGCDGGAPGAVCRGELSLSLRRHRHVRRRIRGRLRTVTVVSVVILARTSYAVATRRNEALTLRLDATALLLLSRARHRGLLVSAAATATGARTARATVLLER